MARKKRGTKIGQDETVTMLQELAFPSADSWPLEKVQEKVDDIQAIAGKEPEFDTQESLDLFEKIISLQEKKTPIIVSAHAEPDEEDEAGDLDDMPDSDSEDDEEIEDDEPDEDVIEAEIEDMPEDGEEDALENLSEPKDEEETKSKPKASKKKKKKAVVTKKKKKKAPVLKKMKKTVKKTEKKERELIPLDKFGNREGSIASKFNEALTDEPQTMKELLSKMGHTERMYNHVNALIEKGLVVKTVPAYKLAKKKK